MANISNFTSNLVNIVIGIVLVCSVALPIVASMTISDSIENSAAIKSLIGVVPLLIVVGLVLMAIRSYISNKE